MKCVICKLNEAITTDCRCENCIGKPLSFSFGISDERREENIKLTPEEERKLSKSFFKS